MDLSKPKSCGELLKLRAARSVIEAKSQCSLLCDCYAVDLPVFSYKIQSHAKLNCSHPCVSLLFFYGPKQGIVMNVANRIILIC